VPIISLASAGYFFLRHVVDLLNLLTVFKHEIDSQGRFIDMATNTVLGYLIVYQVVMLFYLMQRECNDEAFICSIISVISIIYIVSTDKPITHPKET
jgi:hypothetical protein